MLRRTKVKQLWVDWQQGIMTIEIRHSGKELHRYRLQRVPHSFYRDMLRRADPEVLMNQLLTMYSQEV